MPLKNWALHIRLMMASRCPRRSWRKHARLMSWRRSGEEAVETGSTEAKRTVDKRGSPSSRRTTPLGIEFAQTLPPGGSAIWSTFTCVDIFSHVRQPCRRSPPGRAPTRGPPARARRSASLRPPRTSDPESRVSSSSESAVLEVAIAVPTTRQLTTPP